MKMNCSNFRVRENKFLKQLIKCEKECVFHQGTITVIQVEDVVKNNILR